jgi:transcriptional regulator
MQRVRVAHRELGRALVRIVRASFKEADASSIRLTIDGEEIVMYDISEAIATKRVVSAEFVAAGDEQSIPTNSRLGLFSGEGDDPMV